MMLVCCVQVFMLLTTMLETGVLGQGCPRGQFGAGCKSDCHCANYLDCGVNGECPNNDACMWPYFGSDCQDVDELLTDGSSNNPRYLTDGNDSTCNPDANARLIQVTFNTSISTLFIRIRTNNNITLFYRNFTREANISICPVTQLYRVDDKTADIRCHNDAPTMIIRMESRLVPYICTMHVSGGRLISLRRPANQSSTYSGDNWDKVKADNAVDGNNSTDFASGSCTRTQRELAHPYFTLKFDVPSNIYKVIIFNTNDAHCPSSKYGDSCQHQCPCSSGVECHQLTGSCEYMPASYCPVGTYGDMCEFPCPENCHYDLCDAHSGGCLHCIPGYKGEFCDQVCTPGTFGINCSLKCPEKCAEPCNHITAVCSCVEGFTGDLCTECVSGLYGRNCSQKCPHLCNMKRCHMLTGECETCIDKYAGPFCEECDSGWFGDNCTKICPRICPGNRCNNITGHCMSCVGGRTGPKCEDCPAGYYGALCEIPCSVYCRNKSCHEVGGACYACIDGYRGEYCHSVLCVCDGRSQSSRRCLLLVYCVQVCMFLTVLLEAGVLGQECPRGQFGDGCRSDCHCAYSLDCAVNGECPQNGPCRKPYFGFDCQSVDVLLTDDSSNIPQYLTDGNDSTCNPDANATSLQLTFRASMWILLFRIRTNNNITLFYRNFTRDASISICDTIYLYRVDDNTADIKCHPDVAKDTLRIVSGIVPHICTMHVSGGQYISHRRPVNQSSTYSGDRLDKVRAENAVDGNNDSCTRTELERETPFFYLKLDIQSNLYRVLIFNTNDRRYRLSQFLLELLDINGDVVWTFSDSSPQPLSVYIIHPYYYTFISALKIQTTSSSASQHVLSLCEVQVLGYANCRPHNYGEHCQYPCACSSGVTCNTVTGACIYTPTSYCPVGRYGDMCEFPCPENCQYGVCDAHSGGCLHCNPGFMGEFCDRVCTPGTFGINCSLKCPENCAEPCHHITAACSCVDRFTGDLCAECALERYGDNCIHHCSGLCYMNICDSVTGECEKCIDKHTGHFCEECDGGWFGENCTKSCPRICPSNICNNITGECMSCVGNRTGPKCEDCPLGYYGTLCDIPCSVYCRNRSCDEVGGACYACIDGYRGEYCHSEIEEKYPPVWLLPLLIPGFMLFVLCFTVGGGNIRHEEQ